MPSRAADGLPSREGGEDREATERQLLRARGGRGPRRTTGRSCWLRQQAAAAAVRNQQAVPTSSLPPPPQLTVSNSSWTRICPVLSWRRLSIWRYSRRSPIRRHPLSALRQAQPRARRRALRCRASSCCGAARNNTQARRRRNGGERSPPVGTSKEFDNTILKINCAHMSPGPYPPSSPQHRALHHAVLGGGGVALEGRHRRYHLTNRSDIASAANSGTPPFGAAPLVDRVNG